MTTKQVHAELPPRHPVQKKPIIDPIPHHPISPPPQNLQSFSHYSLQKQPAWFDDLFCDPEPNFKGLCLQRSASDPVTLLDSLAYSLPSLTPPLEAENSPGNAACTGLESPCLYGPNSPRKRSTSSFSENAIVSALSKYVTEEPMHYLDGNLSNPTFGIQHSDANADICNAVGPNAETQAEKRHPGQRSRIRKLQYIAELEKTVNALQALESELAVRVASLLQERVALSIENSKLKQQVARLQKKKLMVDGDYQFLKKEVKRLKTTLINSQNSKMWTSLGSSATSETGRSEAMRMTLDMENLNIN